VLIDAPAIDWLTFTTWDEFEFIRWQEWQKKLTGDQKTGKIRMYEGIWKGSSFVGEGRQNNRSHGMIRVSGSDSNQAYFELLRGDYAKCTRLDIQFTAPLPAGYSARVFADDLRSSQEGHYERTVTLVENSDGFDTVYLGSRKSDRLARFYVKEIEDQKFLRFEVEYKGAWSQVVSKAIQEERATLAGNLLDFLRSIEVDDTQGVIKLFDQKLWGFEAGLSSPKVIRDKNKTMQWIIDQVTPAMIRLLNDHDVGRELFDHLQNLLDESNITIGGEIDKTDLL